MVRSPSLATASFDSQTICARSRAAAHASVPPCSGFCHHPSTAKTLSRETIKPDASGCAMRCTIESMRVSGLITAPIRATSMSKRFGEKADSTGVSSNAVPSMPNRWTSTVVSTSSREAARMDCTVRIQMSGTVLNMITPMSRPRASSTLCLDRFRYRQLPDLLGGLRKGFV